MVVVLPLRKREGIEQEKKENWPFQGVVVKIEKKKLLSLCPQRWFKAFVKWQIALRDVLSCLSDDKSFPETFWVVCQMTNHSQRRFEPFVRWQIIPRDVLSRLSDDKSSISSGFHKKMEFSFVSEVTWWRIFRFFIFLLLHHGKNCKNQSSQTYKTQ